MNDRREITLSEAAKLLGGKLIGPDATVYGFCSLDTPHPNAVAFVEKPHRFKSSSDAKPAGLIVPVEIEGAEGIAQIIVPDPRVAFAKLMRYFHPPHSVESDFRHPSAVIADDAVIGEPSFIGPGCVIEPCATLGSGCILTARVYIGKGAHIGKGCLFHPGAIVMHDVQIGNRCIIGPGAVIGFDGFGYVPDGTDIIKVPQVGTVLVGDDVEVGANSTIDRATLDATIIGSKTKIDNLVQIAHNVHIGERVRIAAQCGISGGSTVGDDVVMGGQAGVTNGVSIGANAIIGARAGVTRNIHPGQVVSGYPARDHKRQLMVDAACNRLPELFKKYKGLLDDGFGD